MTTHTITEELLRMSELKDLFSKIVADSPPGFASKRKLKSGKVSIFHEYPSKDGRRVRRTLKFPKDEELLEKLKIKNFALKALPILKGNIKFLRGTEGAQFVDFNPRKIEQSLGAAYEGIYKRMRLAPRRKSGSEKFDALADWQNPLREDRDRSLSEMLIEVLLDKYQLPYKYETAFVAGGTTFYPDFAILSPRSGEIVYWEHFGMMDNRDYLDKTTYKLTRYANHGLYLGINLIASFGSKDKKISAEEIETIIKYFLLPQNI